MCWFGLIWFVRVRFCGALFRVRLFGSRAELLYLRKSVQLYVLRLRPFSDSFDHEDDSDSDGDVDLSELETAQAAMCGMLVTRFGFVEVRFLSGHAVQRHEVSLCGLRPTAELPPLL